MKINQWLQDATIEFKANRIPTPRLDSLVLLNYVFEKPKSWILANQDQVIPDSELDKLNELKRRRKQREPIAYLVHSKEFYGYEFYVNDKVMIPRPETEALLDYVISHAPKNGNIIELGTGSGAIAISIAKKRPDITVVATDVSKEALEVAEKNQKLLKADNVSLQQSDLLNSVETQYDWLIANLPYVPEGSEITHEARFEPDIALFAEEKGVGIYRRMFTQLQNRNGFQYVIIEAEPFQRSTLKTIAKESGYKLTRHDGKFFYVFEKQLT